MKYEIAINLVATLFYCLLSFSDQTLSLLLFTSCGKVEQIE